MEITIYGVHHVTRREYLGGDECLQRVVCRVGRPLQAWNPHATAADRATYRDVNN